MTIKRRLVVDQDKCIGCGTCVALYPEIFELNGEGKAEVKFKEFKDSSWQSKIEEAIESCPVEAIGSEEK